MQFDPDGRRQIQLDLRHLRLVAAVADAGGQTRASRRLNLTQSALSHQLRELEARIGAPLFIRASRRMVLTPIGERVLLSARRVLHEVENLERDLVTDQERGGAGVVRLATECYTCYHWLPAVVRAFREEWPQVDVRIVAEATADPVKALLDGALDLAIVAGDVDERRLGRTSLFEDEQVVVVAPGHPLAARAFVSPEDLRDEHLILYTTHSSESTVLYGRHRIEARRDQLLAHPLVVGPEAREQREREPVVRVGVLRVEDYCAAECRFGIVPASAEQVHAADGRVRRRRRVIERHGTVGGHRGPLDRGAQRHVIAAPHDDPRIREPAPRVRGTRVALDGSTEVTDRAFGRGTRSLVPVVSPLRDDARSHGVDRSRALATRRSWSCPTDARSIRACRRTARR